MISNFNLFKKFFIKKILISIIKNSDMNTEFITTNSRLSVKNDTIWQKRIIEPPKNYWFHSFILLLFLLGFSVYDAIPEKPYKWIMVFVIIMWMTPHIMTIYQILFIKTWKSNIRLSDIKSVRTENEENELEEKVFVKLKSGREKIYFFRKSENQAEKFVLLISSQTSLVSPVNQ